MSAPVNCLTVSNHWMWLLKNDFFLNLYFWLCNHRSVCNSVHSTLLLMGTWLPRVAWGKILSVCLISCLIPGFLPDKLFTHEQPFDVPLEQTWFYLNFCLLPVRHPLSVIRFLLSKQNSLWTTQPWEITAHCLFYVNYALSLQFLLNVVWFSSSVVLIIKNIWAY